jgi:hypothetical protein
MISALIELHVVGFRIKTGVSSAGCLQRWSDPMCLHILAVATEAHLALINQGLHFSKGFRDGCVGVNPAAAAAAAHL